MQTLSVSEARAEAAAMVVQVLLKRLPPDEFERLKGAMLPEKVQGLLRGLPWAEFAEVLAEAKALGYDLGHMVIMEEMDWLFSCRK